MDGYVNLNRRGFLGGLISAIAAPAIVRVDSIMPIFSMPDALTLENYSRNNLLTIDMITREAIKLFQNTNIFLINAHRQYDDSKFIGSQLKIKNYRVN